jgi:hypothetical protein
MKLAMTVAVVMSTLGFAIAMFSFMSFHRESARSGVNPCHRIGKLWSTRLAGHDAEVVPTTPTIWGVHALTEIKDIL